MHGGEPTYMVAWPALVYPGWGARGARSDHRYQVYQLDQFKSVQMSSNEFKWILIIHLNTFTLRGGRGRGLSCAT